MSATSTQWVYADDRPTDDGFTLINNRGGHTVGHVTHQDDAAFIVKAVNAYDALKAENAALREALELIVDVYGHGGIPIDEHFDRIKAALAQGENDA